MAASKLEVAASELESAASELEMAASELEAAASELEAAAFEQMAPFELVATPQPVTASEQVATIEQAAVPEQATLTKSIGLPRYGDWVVEAVVALKERAGSSLPTIKKWIEAHHGLELSGVCGTTLLMAIRRLTLSGKLVQVKDTFKLGEVGEKIKTAVIGKSSPPSVPAVAQSAKGPHEPSFTTCVMRTMQRSSAGFCRSLRASICGAAVDDVPPPAALPKRLSPSPSPARPVAGQTSSPSPKPSSGPSPKPATSPNHSPSPVCVAPGLSSSPSPKPSASPSLGLSLSGADFSLDPDFSLGEDFNLDSSPCASPSGSPICSSGSEDKEAVVGELAEECKNWATPLANDVVEAKIAGKKAARRPWYTGKWRKERSPESQRIPSQDEEQSLDAEVSSCATSSSDLEDEDDEALTDEDSSAPSPDTSTVSRPSASSDSDASQSESPSDSSSEGVEDMEGEVSTGRKRAREDISGDGVDGTPCTTAALETSPPLEHKVESLAGPAAAPGSDKLEASLAPGQTKETSKEEAVTIPGESKEMEDEVPPAKRPHTGGAGAVWSQRAGAAATTAGKALATATVYSLCMGLPLSSAWLAYSLAFGPYPSQ